MQLKEYLAKKELRPSAPTQPFCVGCLSPQLTCYCQVITRFDPQIVFAILIHHCEAQKRIATGRISHRCLENSLLLNGYDYTQDARVNALIADPAYHCVVLYPGASSRNLSSLSDEEKKTLVPPGKKLLVFVIDGTWITARKTMQRSRNLEPLPRISFQPPTPSRFRVRKQPKAECYSTIEAIHHTIELLGESQGFPIANREHDSLLRVFDHVVEQRLELAQSRQRNHRR